MDGVSVSADAGNNYFAIRILEHLRLVGNPGPALHRLVEGIAGVVHPERKVLDAVAMQPDMIGNGTVGSQRRGEHQAHLVLLQLSLIHISEPTRLLSISY